MSDIDIIVLMCFNEQINHHWDYWFLVFPRFLRACVRVRACMCVLARVRVLGCHQNWHSLLTKIFISYAQQSEAVCITIWDQQTCMRWCFESTVSRNYCLIIVFIIYLMMCKRITNQLAALVRNKTTHSLGVYKEVVDNFFHLSIFFTQKNGISPKPTSRLQPDLRFKKK